MITLSWPFQCALSYLWVGWELQTASEVKWSVYGVRSSPGLNVVLVESVTVGLVRGADNGSPGVSVVLGFCGQS